MKHILIYLFALLTLTSCSDDKVEVNGGGDNPGTNPSQPNETINNKLFEVINLDYPGLEKVKEYYEADQHYLAAQTLLEYYRTRTGVVNPKVTLINITASEDDKLKADNALDSYRFFVNNYFENAEQKKSYSLSKEGKIDWTFKPQGADDEYQKQLHRHQWFVPQAKVYRTTNEEKYIRSWIEVYGDWLKQNPMPASGTNNTTWWQLQVAERVYGQVDLFDYYKHSVNFTPEWLSTFMVAFADHADFLVKYPYPSGGNILVSQANALAFAGTLYPEFRNAADWLNTGYQTLGNQVKEQFLADGMHFELDLSYHISAIADFYETMKLAEANNITDKLPANFNESLRKAAEVVMHFTYPNFFDAKLKGYCVPGFNDTRQESWTRNVLTRNFKRYVEMFPDQEEFLYMSTAGKQGTCPDSNMKTFVESGYYVLRNGWDKSSTMLIHSNNFSTDALKTWSHNQPDNGTFELYHNGRNFLPDTGVFSYYTQGGDNSNRIWYRQTRVHNTMTLDHKDITDAKGKLLKAGTEGNHEVIVTENQGYANFRHRRYIFFVDKKFFVLADEGIGNAAGTVNLNFNLCEGSDSEVVVDPTLQGAYTGFADGNNLVIRTFSNESITTRPFNGKVSYKPGVEASRKAYTVNQDKASGETARFITVLYPVNGAAGKATEVSATFATPAYDEKGISLQVTVNGQTYELSYKL